MSADDKKLPKLDKRTLVGVPVIVEGARPPIPEPSQTEIGEPPDMHAAAEANTGVDVKAMSAAEAERVLQWTGFTQEEIPTAPSPEKSPKPGTRPESLPTKVGTPAILSPPSAATSTARGVAPQAPIRPPTTPTHRGTPRAAPAPPASLQPQQPKGRSTLLLDNSVPPIEPSSDTGEHVPIVVPSAGGNAPKAVTQPPPWGGGMQVGADIPRAAAAPRPMRPREPSSEEISASMMIDEQGNIEELSGSILLDETPGKNGGPPRPGVKTAPGFAVPRAHHGPTKPSAAVSPSKAPPGVTPSKPPTPPAPAVKSSVPPPPVAPVTFAKSPSARPPAPAAASRPPPAVPPGTSTPPLPLGVPVPDEIKLDLPAFPAPPSASSPPPAQPAAAVPDPFAPPAATNGASPSMPPPEVAPSDAGPLARLIPPGSILRNRPKWFLPAVGVGGFIVGVGLIGLILSAFRGSSSDSSTTTTTTRSSAVAKASASPPATTATATAAPVAKPAPAPVAKSTAACATGGDAHTVAANALVSAGVETVTAGDGLALGFATDPKAAMAVLVDPSSLAATSTARSKTLAAIRRVVPYVDGNKKLSVVIDTDRRGDSVAGRRTISTTPPFDLGGSGSQVVAATHGGGVASRLWSLDGDGGAPEQIRAVKVPGASDTWAVAFRRGGAIWAGTATGADAKSLSTSGSLARFAGLGDARLGSPTIAASGDEVLVAWADRSSAGDPYQVRLVRWKVGETPGDATTFTPPAGGLGQESMSPGAAGLAGGRFLLVWTEGPTGNHQVRAQTLGASDGAPLGSPLTISAEGVNAGQGQVAVLDDGRGIVAFLAASGKSFELVAVPVTCAL